MNSDKPISYYGEETYETDDINFAGLLRAKGIRQTGKRVEADGDPDRPHYWFEFGDRTRCLALEDALQLDDVPVGFNALSREIVQVRNQVFQRRTRNRR
jgi:hypothetical protein